MDAANLFDRPSPPDPSPELDRDDLRVLFATAGVRGDTKASARIAGSLGGVQSRLAVARATRRLGGSRPERVPSVDPDNPIGVGGRLLGPTGIRSHIIGRPRRSITRRA